MPESSRNGKAATDTIHGLAPLGGLRGGGPPLPQWVQGVRDMAKLLLAVLDAGGIRRCIRGVSHFAVEDYGRTRRNLELLGEEVFPRPRELAAGD